MERTWRRSRGLALLSLLLASLGSVAGLACDSPPQILEISPVRGAQDVRTNLPIRIRFDRSVDRASVQARLSLHPSVAGQVAWEASNTLVFRHDTLQTSAQYTVSLTAGYRDSSGNVNAFNHSWSFRTEAAPNLRSTLPGAGDSRVDPATYLTLAFSREMDPLSFSEAVSFTPAVSYAARSDPADARRILVAPNSLLSPNTNYQVSISDSALDVDGNHLAPAQVSFQTGAVRSLARWITFIAATNGSASGEGVWMVDDAGFPRVLENGVVDTFSWSPDGSNLLIRHPDGSWTDYPLGSNPVRLDFKAGWAAYLGPDSGYVYLDGSQLTRTFPSGQTAVIAGAVTSAAVSRDLGRIVFASTASTGTDVRVYDAQLRTQYRIQHETGTVAELTWAPNGSNLAYVVSTGSPNSRELRVKSLTGAASVTTVATSSISDPAWLADSSDLTFTAQVVDRGIAEQRVFRVNTSLPLAALSASAALGPAGQGDAFLPRPSPDGHQIAFLLGTSENAQVWVMNADGTGATRLTSFDAAAFPYTVRALHWAGP